MTYEYRCESCLKHFDVIKSVQEMEREERCPTCEAVSQRQFVPRSVHFSGTRVQHAEFNPAFGKVVRNKYHRSELAKRHNMVEIGNDYKSPDSIHKQFDQVREEKRGKAWESIEL